MAKKSGGNKTRRTGKAGKRDLVRRRKASAYAKRTVSGRFKEMDDVGRSQKADKPRLNGEHFRVSDRKELSEAVISVGLAKTDKTIDSNLPLFEAMIHKVRKCRVLGSAALDMAYVACGRFDAYIERGISLWDIAAGWILVETAGGTVDLRPREDMKDKYAIVASNGVIDLKL